MDEPRRDVGEFRMNRCVVAETITVSQQFAVVAGVDHQCVVKYSLPLYLGYPRSEIPTVAFSPHLDIRRGE